MTQAPLQYWQPGSEERQLRIFISHRFGKDQALYDDVIRALEGNRFSVQDMSLSAAQAMAGPRGGDLPRLEIQAEIAARIYTSDALIAPSRVGTSRSRWVSWEVQLAAIGYGIPILFVNEAGQRRSTTLVSEVAGLELPHAVCEHRAQDIVTNLIRLIDGRPNWGMRQEEIEPTIRFRGPPQATRNDVLNKFPFRPRLEGASPLLQPPQKRGLWGLFSSNEHRT